MIIQAKNLSATINGRNIFSDISVVAVGKEITAITGPSGCGKTTLLNCLGLIQPISSGEITIDSESTIKWKEREKTAFWQKNAAFIYQDYGIIDEETVAFNVALSNKKDKIRRITPALRNVGLLGREKDLAVVLSGGEKQRLGIARAIFKNAAVIYADEPTASLDIDNRERVINLLLQCAKRGSAVIIATHDDSLIKKCNTVVEI